MTKQEMRLLEATRRKPNKLEQLFDALLSIPSTSVGERAFCAAGLFATKLRSRVTDKAVNTSRFLRSHYEKVYKSNFDAFFVIYLYCRLCIPTIYIFMILVFLLFL